MKIPILIGFLFLSISICAQPGQIIETGDQVLDPNGDGFTSLDNTGFSGDSLDVDEFEIVMFGVPIVGEGESLGDIQAGSECGVTDLALDAEGYTIYGAIDSSNNLIFRFRLAGDKPSVQAYSIMIDTDELIGSADPNSSTENPGFEIELTLIQKQEVRVFDIDGLSSCNPPVLTYDIDTHQQKSIAGSMNCGDEDYLLDFYIPLADLTAEFGITTATLLRFAGVTNISATCAIDGKISDIGGVDDNDYGGCVSCAFEEIIDNQCPTAIDSLCASCSGFPEGPTNQPTIDVPLEEGDDFITGLSDPLANIFIRIYDGTAGIAEEDTTMADDMGVYSSNLLQRPLQFDDSVVVVAFAPGKCGSDQSSTPTSFAIVDPTSNSPPVLTGTTFPLSYLEGSGAIPIDTGILIQDDSTFLQGALITISINYLVSEDLLGFTDQSGIAGTYDPGSGSLSLNGSATLDQYRSALRSVTYTNTSGNPNLSIRNVSIIVDDGTQISNAHTREIFITPLNNPPEVTENGNPVDTITRTTMEDIPIEICLEATDQEGHSVDVISGLSLTSNGVLELDPPGDLCFDYIPNLDFNGMDTLQIFVCDNGVPVQCDTIIVLVQVDPVNDPPQILFNGMPVDTLQESILEDQLLSTCLEVAEPDGDSVAIQSVTLILPFGEITIDSLNDLCLQYSPPLESSGSVDAKILVCDNANPSLCDSVILQVLVIPVNDPPIALNDTLGGQKNFQISGNLLENDSDIEGDSLFVAITPVVGALNGTVEIETNGDLVYTPNADFTGTDVLTYQVCDSGSPTACSTAQAFFLVADVTTSVSLNLADTFTVSTLEDQAVEVCFDDPDNLGLDIIFGVSNTGHGLVDVNPLDDFCFVFVPNLNYNGFDTIQVVACTPGQAECDTLIGIVEVLPLNDPPILLDDGEQADTLRVQSNEDEVFELCLQATDPDGDALRLDDLLSATNNGEFEIDSEALCLSFTPDLNFSGSEIFQVWACDDRDPQLCDSVVVDLTILPVNDPPLAVDDTVFGQKDFDLEGSVLGNDTDVEGDSLVVTTTPASFPLNGGVVIGSDGRFFYSPNPGFVGTDVFDYQVCDSGIPEECSIGQVFITIADVSNSISIDLEDPFTVSVTEDTPVEVCFIDSDNQGVDVLFGGSIIDLGRVDIEPLGDLCFVYFPDANFNGMDTLQIIVCTPGFGACDTLTGFVEVLPVNDSPQILVNGIPTDSIIASSLEDYVYSLCLDVQDTDGDIVVIDELNLLNNSGQVAVNPNDPLCFDYLPEENFNDSEVIEVIVCDDSEAKLCDTLIINLDIIPVNDQPQAVNDTLFGMQDQEIRGNVLLNDSDVEGDLLQVSPILVSGPERGEVNLSLDGNFSYFPDLEFEGIDQFMYQVCDSGAPSECDTATVLLIIDKEIIDGLVVYQAVSPNGDGLNDFWLIKGISEFPENRVRLFDRWNNLVYEENDYNNKDRAWEGQSNKGLSSQDVQDGTYYYVIDLSTGVSYNGFLVLKR